MVCRVRRPIQEQIMSQAFEAHSSPTEAVRPNEMNLVWIDMEMTGLVPESERIIEIALIITDAQLRPLAEGPVIVVHQADTVLIEIGVTVVDTVV